MTKAESCRIYYARNRDAVNSRRRAAYAKNPERVLNWNRKAMTLEEKSEYNRIYHLANQDSERKKSLEYYYSNKPLYRAYEANKYKNDPSWKLRRNLGNRMRELVRLSGSGVRKLATEVLIGCDLDFARNFIEAQFKKGMSWENHGKWHIDHVIPCAFFDLTKIEDQRRCFNYSNLRPMWARKNIQKRATLPGPHQPLLI